VKKPYDLWLEARSLIKSHTQQDSAEARRLLEEAIQLDRKFARGYGLLSYVAVQECWRGWVPDPAAACEKALELALQAVGLDPDDYDSRWSAAIAYLWNEDYERAISSFERARQGNPYDTDLLVSMSDGLVAVGRAEEALEQTREAIRRSGGKPPAWHRWNEAFAALMAHHYDEAVQALEPITGEIDAARVYLAAAYVLNGQKDKAIEEVSKLGTRWTVAQAARQPLQRQADKDLWVTALREAGLPEN
jgi:tetratricopeptide (TPR) repeat protein